MLKLSQQKADGTVFPCLLALHPVVNLAVRTGFHYDVSHNDGAYVRVTESMTEKHSSHGHDLEYKYQIWLFIDSSLPPHVHSLEITEMARILRILPQSVFNQMLPGATAAVAQLEDLCNIKSFSRSFLTEFAENIDVTRNLDSSNGHHLSTIRGIVCRPHLPLSSLHISLSLCYSHPAVHPLSHTPSIILICCLSYSLPFFPYFSFASSFILYLSLFVPLLAYIKLS